MRAISDVRVQIEEVRRSDILGSREFLSRLALISSGSAVGFFGMGLEAIPYWYAAYYAAVMSEKLLLIRFPKAVSRAFMSALFAISIVISSVYVALPLHMWFLGGDIWQFAAMVMLVAGCLNIYQLRSRAWVVALAYFLPIATAFVVIAFDFRGPSGGGAEFWSALALAILITGYFALSVVEANKASTRTARVQAQLMQSQKIEALDALAAGISHDFRNLLSVIQGNLELLEHEPKAGDRRACIRDALAASRNATELGVQLGLYARGVSAKPTMVDPVKVIDEVRRMAHHVLPSTINFQTETPTSMIGIRVDKSGLQAVLLNLIVHARDSASGSGTISLETYVTEPSERLNGYSQAGAKVVFEVSDTSSIILSDRPASVDLPHAGSGRARPGNGLALASAHGFAEHFGGEFRIERNRECGTCARLELPV